MSETKENYKKQEKAALMSFLFGLPGFIGLVVIIVMTGSLVTLIDFLDSLCNLIRDGFVFALSRKLQTNLKYEFNYGISRLEALSGLSCDSIMVAGLIIVFCSSIRELFAPSAPSGVLLFALVCKIGAVLTDSYMLYKQYKIKKLNNNGVTRVAYAGALKNLAFDGVILLVYIFSFIFRDVPATYYVSPVLCIIIAVVLGRQSILRIIDNVSELTDKTLDEEMQMKIIKVMNRYFDSYDQLLAINSHKINDMLFIDLKLSFDSNEKYEDIVRFKKDLEKDLTRELGNLELTIIVS